MKTIKADVLYNWDHVANKGCKFLPKDLVKINHIPSYQSQLANSYAGQIGTVIAVSSGAPGLIRGDYRRQFTRYYVEMQDGEIIGTHSHYLTKAEKRMIVFTMTEEEFDHMYEAVDHYVDTIGEDWSYFFQDDPEKAERELNALLDKIAECKTADDAKKEATL